MEITQEQIKILTGEKCPECKGYSDYRYLVVKDCKSCKGTGLPTIEIEKEWVECKICSGQGGWYIGNEETGEGNGESCQDCDGKGKIPKYKVGEEIWIECGKLEAYTKEDDGEIVCNSCGECIGHNYPDGSYCKYCGTVIKKEDSFRKKLKIISEQGDKWIIGMVR